MSFPRRSVHAVELFIWTARPGPNLSLTTSYSSSSVSDWESLRSQKSTPASMRSSHTSLRSKTLACPPDETVTSPHRTESDASAASV